MSKKSKWENITNKIYGKLLATSRGPDTLDKRTRWFCNCDCGVKNFLVLKQSLVGGLTKSCGCLNESVRKNNHFRKHGLYSKNPKLCKHYESMISRCYNNRHKNFKNYNSKGITVCDRWLGDEGLSNFFADMSFTWTPKMTLDRIDNAGIYCPQNCRWIPHRENCLNKKSSLVISYKGKDNYLSFWSDELGISYGVLYNRIYKSHWDIETAFNTKTKKRESI